MCILLGVCPLTYDTLGRAAGMKDGPVPLVPESERLQRGEHKVRVPHSRQRQKAKVLAYSLAFACIIWGEAVQDFKSKPDEGNTMGVWKQGSPRSMWLGHPL